MLGAGCGVLLSLKRFRQSAASTVRAWMGRGWKAVSE